MEFAVGSLAGCSGRSSLMVDGYKVRVRLPDEPLMLVDRILSVEGEKGSMQSGRVTTEHDVQPGAWYLDGGRAPALHLHRGGTGGPVSLLLSGHRQGGSGKTGLPACWMPG